MKQSTRLLQTFLSAILLLAARAQADPLRLDFDAVDATAGRVPAASYLASFGISVTDVTPGTTVVIDNIDLEYGGNASRASSSPNGITQIGSNDPVSFTLRFCAPMDSVSFTRAKLIVATASGVTHPEWSAHAFDANGTEVATVGEPLLGSYADVPAASFTLNGPGIVAVRFDSNNYHFAAFNAALLDDLVFNTSVARTCPHSQGDWKNNPDAWPVGSLTLGSQTYSEAELLALLAMPVGASRKADASLILAKQLIAAKLNIADCTDPAPAGNTMLHADGVLGGFAGKLPNRVSTTSSEGKAMLADATVLERYNNAGLTPGCTQ